MAMVHYGLTIQLPHGWRHPHNIAITMLNTKSMSVSCRQWCKNNGLTTMLAKFLDNEEITIMNSQVTINNDKANPFSSLTAMTTLSTLTMFGRQFVCRHLPNFSTARGCDNSQ
eukprot:881317-Amphidinium_carterae.2